MQITKFKKQKRKEREREGEGEGEKNCTGRSVNYTAHECSDYVIIRYLVPRCKCAKEFRRKRARTQFDQLQRRFALEEEQKKKRKKRRERGRKKKKLFGEEKNEFDFVRHAEQKCN